MDVAVQGGDGARVQLLVVDEQDVVMGVPAVVVAPGELERDDVPGNAEAALESPPSDLL